MRHSYERSCSKLVFIGNIVSCLYAYHNYKLSNSKLVFIHNTAID